MTPFDREERIVIAPLPEDMNELLKTQLDPSAEPEEETAETPVPEEESVQEEAVPEQNPEPAEKKPAEKPAARSGRAGDAILAALAEKEAALGAEEPKTAVKKKKTSLSLSWEVWKFRPGELLIM